MPAARGASASAPAHATLRVGPPACPAGGARRAKPRRGAGRNPHLQLEVTRLALETISLLRPLVPRIRRHDRSLTVQLVRAASSAALNLGEGEQSDPGTRRARYCNAAGSANETRTALAVAVAWGYLSSAQAEPASRRLDRVVAMLWKLTHG